MLQGAAGQRWRRETELEATAFLSAYLASNITHQAVEYIYALEVVDEPCILSLAFLQQVVFVEYGFEGYVILVQQAVD